MPGMLSGVATQTAAQWMVIGLVAVALVYPAYRGARWNMATRQATIVISAYLLYFSVRGLTEGSVDRAVANGWRVVDFEKRLGLFHEAKIQAFVVDHQALVNLANWVYIWGHWPVIVAVATWLILRHPDDFLVYRNAFLVSGAVGLVIFATFPVAPPRLLSMDLVDTVTEHSKAYRVLQPPAFVNQYAAVPSLHFGWNLLIGIALVRTSPSRIVKAFGVVSPVLMGLAIVATANHYLLDAILGGTVALIGLWFAVNLPSLLHRLPAPAGDRAGASVAGGG